MPSKYAAIIYRGRYRVDVSSRKVTTAAVVAKFDLKTEDLATRFPNRPRRDKGELLAARSASKC